MPAKIVSHRILGSAGKEVAHLEISSRFGLQISKLVGLERTWAERGAGGFDDLGVVNQDEGGSREK